MVFSHLSQINAQVPEIRGRRLAATCIFSVSLILLLLICSLGTAWSSDPNVWSKADIAVLRSLWIGSLPPLPKDPSNAFADNPKAAELGRRFFFDNRFSGNAKVSCATCHRPDMNFTDDLPVAHGMGNGMRRTMPLVGVTYNSWFFWDGRRDSLWSQALAPIENPREHGFTRTQCVSVIRKYYLKDYEKIFGPMPEISDRDLSLHAEPSAENPAALKKWVFLPRKERASINRIYANMGKAIAAFVRTILPGESRFDRYVEALLNGDGKKMESTLSTDEVMGLRLFIGKAKCINCHNGPLFSDGDFQVIHVPDPAGVPHDRGRADAIPQVLMDEFNCAGQYSDAKPGDCGELRFMNTDVAEYVGAFKSPSLRNVAERPPYMHAGQFATLRQVLEFYRDLKPEQRSPQLDHGELTDLELSQIEVFLRTLTGPVKFQKQ